MSRSGTVGFGDPDAARDAALIDGVGHLPQAQRLSPRGMPQGADGLRARRMNLRDRLRLEGGDPGELVEIADAALYEEVLRLEREIGAAMTKSRGTPIEGLDEPFGDEPMAAE